VNIAPVKFPSGARARENI